MRLVSWEGSVKYVADMDWKLAAGVTIQGRKMIPYFQARTACTKVVNAVYRVRLKDGGGNWHRIPRVCGEDPTGTLYIGCTKSTSSPLSMRHNVTSAPGRKHFLGHRQTGWCLWLSLPDFLRGAYPAGIVRGTSPLVTSPNLLWLEYVHLNPVQDAEKWEADALLEYVKNFGELPPYNLGTPRTHPTQHGHRHWAAPVFSKQVP
jgi:hypothetical protein